jgi:hypothetical protein
MKKFTSVIIFVGMLLSACNLPVAQKATETPTPTAVIPTGTATLVPTETAPAASATPEFAPFCDPDAVSVAPPAQCQMPIAKESSIFCSKKKPYNLLLINKNALFEVQTEGFRCIAEGMKDGKKIVTCTGTMAASFEVTVCDPTCAAPTVPAEITTCPDGYYFNNLQGCCMQGLQQVNQNCVTLKLTTTSCKVDCSIYPKKATCNQHSDTCYWSAEDNSCELRK